MSFQTLFTKMEDHTLIITINRPEKLNALNQQVMQDLDAVFDRVYKFPEIKFSFLIFFFGNIFFNFYFY